MKLCRFELIQDPGVARSGILHENRMYETDGENAIGVHDLGKVLFLSPIGQPPSVRMFDVLGERLTFRYHNSGAILGQDNEVEAPPNSSDFVPELRIAMVVRDAGESIDVEEAPPFLLGYSVCIAFIARDVVEEERRQGLAPCRSVDFPIVVGPMLTTPEEFVDKAPNPQSPTAIPWTASLSVNGSVLLNVEGAFCAPFAELAAFATVTLPLREADLLLGPPLLGFALPESKLGRALQPRDALQVSVEGLGTLLARIT